MTAMKNKMLVWMKDGVGAYFLELLNRIVTVNIFSTLTRHIMCSYNEIGL